MGLKSVILAKVDTSFADEFAVALSATRGEIERAECGSSRTSCTRALLLGNSDLLIRFLNSDVSLSPQKFQQGTGIGRRKFARDAHVAQRGIYDN
jgi:hypothetical protein